MDASTNTLTHLMAANNDTAELERAKKYIYTSDLNSVFERLVHIEKWKRQHADKAIKQYRNYLYLRKKYAPRELPPSDEIDEAWHAHVLHTKDYFEFCDKVFGHYLHHNPHVANADHSVEKLNAMFSETQELYKKEFGTYIYSVKDTLLQNMVLWIFSRKQ